MNEWMNEIAYTLFDTFIYSEPMQRFKKKTGVMWEDLGFWQHEQESSGCSGVSLLFETVKDYLKIT